MRQILKQTSWLFFAQVLTRGVSFFYVIFLARNLGVSDFGLYTVALAYFSIISSLADFGFNRFLVREVAIDKSKTFELLWNIVILRLTLTSVFFAIFAIILYSLDPDKIRVSLILLATLSILPQAVAFTFDAIFIAIQKLQFSAISLFVSSLVTAASGYLLIKGGFEASGAVSALIFGQLVYAVALIIFLAKFKGLHFAAIRVTVIKKALKGSLPYGILGILGLLYFRVDTVMLSYLRGSFETGIYGAAYKFLEALVFVPNALSFALFPKFVELHNSGGSQQIKKLLMKNIKWMFALGVLITTGYYFFLPEIIKLLLPNYLSSIPAIKILAFSVPFMFIHVPASVVLISSHKYLKAVILLSIIPLSINLILNFIFIPQFGFLAASVITVISDIISTVLLLIFIFRLIPAHD